jgi:transposase InsO family protein
VSLGSRLIRPRLAKQRQRRPRAHAPGHDGAGARAGALSPSPAALIAPRKIHPRPPPAGGKPDVSADKPNALWTADYKGWWRTGDLKRCQPLTVRDQHSRFVLAGHVCRSPQLQEALQLFERLFELHGIPERILTDNGTPFVAPSSRFGLTRLSAWWLSLGIDHLRSRKGTPAGNGGHERMHRDIAFEVEAIAAATYEDQQRACDLWKADFNNCRPHEALGMKTPSQVYKPSATSYAEKKIELLYPERMLVRTLSGRGFIKYRSTSSTAARPARTGIVPTDIGHDSRLQLFDRRLNSDFAEPRQRREREAAHRSSSFTPIFGSTGTHSSLPLRALNERGGRGGSMRSCRCDSSHSVSASAASCSMSCPGGAKVWQPGAGRKVGQQGLTLLRDDRRVPHSHRTVSR